MKESRKQTTRLIKFCHEMKRGHYPNRESFAALLRRADIDEKLDIACTSLTVQRDIDFLRNTYRAPVEFDAARMTDPDWTLEIQLPLEHEDFLIHSLLALKTLQQIAPQPLKKKMAETIEQARVKNRTSFLNHAFIESMPVASGMKVAISPGDYMRICST